MPAAYIPILLFAALAIMVPAAWMTFVYVKAPKSKDQPQSASPSEQTIVAGEIVAEEITVVACETSGAPIVEEIRVEEIIVQEIDVEQIVVAATPAAPLTEPLDQANASLFFLVAALFVIFSVAIILALPWALRFRGWIEEGQGSAAFFALLSFFAILLVAYAWLRKQRLLDEQPFDQSRPSS